MLLWLNGTLQSEVSESLSVMSDSMRSSGLYSPWNSPGQNTGMDSHYLLQGVFPTQGSNPGLPHFRWILYQLSHQDVILFIYPFIHYYTISCTLHCKLQNQRTISTGLTLFPVPSTTPRK